MRSFSLLRGNKHASRTSLIVDIGGGSVGAALVQYDGFSGGRKGSVSPAVLYTTREEYLFLENLNFERFSRAMLEALDTVLARVQRDGLPLVPRRARVDDVAVVYASPWYASETQIVRYAKPAPFAISGAFVHSVTQKAAERFQAAPHEHVAQPTKKSASPDTHKKDDVVSDVLLEQSIMRIRLNGYETALPIGKAARTFEMDLFVSMASPSVVHKVDETVLKHFGSIGIQSFACNHMLFSVLRDLYTETGVFLFLHIGGEISDVSLVRDGTLSATVSFPFGIHTLIRRTAHELSTVAGEAMTLLRANAPVKKRGDNPERSGEKSDDKPSAERIEKVIAGSRDEWQEALREAFGQLTGDASLPSTVFVVAENDIGAWFAQFAETVGKHGSAQEPDTGKFYELNNGLERKSDLRVVFLRDRLLSGLLSAPKQGDPDLFLYAECIFYGKIMQ